MRIFVQIASYRDSELEPTVKDAIRKAKNPQNLRFGIIHQRSKEDHFTLTDNHIRLIKIDYEKSKGACWARSQVQSLYNNEEYTLQIDSHSRFADNWDEKLINMLNELPSKKPIISTYPAAYTPPSNLIQYNGMVRMGLNQQSKFPPTFNSTVTKKTLKPEKNYYISGGFYFTHGQFILEVPYDPNIYFHGEEIALSLRAYTHGWDVYSPNDIIIYHFYGRRNFPKHWTDYNKWNELEEVSKKRIENLFKGDIVDKYGIGTIRPISSFFKFIGYTPPWDRNKPIEIKPNELEQHINDLKNKNYIKPISKQEARRKRLIMNSTIQSSGTAPIKKSSTGLVLRHQTINGLPPIENINIMRPPLIGRKYDDIVDKVYIINLKRRDDRLRHIVAQMYKHGIKNYEIIEAVDSKEIKIPEWWTRYPSGSYGCLISHIKAVQKAYDDGVDCAHIIEDDAVLCDDFKSKFNDYYSSVPGDWDMIFTSGSHISKPIDVVPGVSRMTFSYVAHSYFIRRHMLKPFIDIKSSQNIRNDMYNTLIQLSYNVYMPSRHLSWTTPSYSDNERRVVDHYWLRDENTMYKFSGPYKTNLNNLVCIIAFRDITRDKSRTRNLKKVIDYYTRMVPEMCIVIVEQAPDKTLIESQYPKNVTIVYQKNDGKFNKGDAYNIGASIYPRKTNILFNDSDILVTYESFEKSIKLLHTYDSVSPYVKCLYMTNNFVNELDDNIVSDVNSINDFSNVALHFKSYNDWGGTTQKDSYDINGHKPLSISKNENVPYSGGAMFITRNAFDHINGWFDNYQGWGAEDRAMDVKIFAFLTHVYIDSYCLHLWHSRGGNDESIPGRLTLEWTKDNDHHYYDNLNHLTEIRKLDKPTLYREIKRYGYKQRLHTKRIS